MTDPFTAVMGEERGRQEWRQHGFQSAAELANHVYDVSEGTDLDEQRVMRLYDRNPDLNETYHREIAWCEGEEDEQDKAFNSHCDRVLEENHYLYTEEKRAFIEAAHAVTQGYTFKQTPLKLTPGGVWPAFVPPQHPNCKPVWTLPNP